AAPAPEPDLARQRKVVDAFFAAAHGGDFDALVAVLDPDVVLRSHSRDGVQELRGAKQVAGGASAAQRQLRPTVRPVLVAGPAGVVAYDPDGQPFAILAFTVADDRIATVDIYNEPDLVTRVVGRS